MRWKMTGQQRDKQHVGKEWTGSTNFEERPQFKDEFITEDIDEQQEARKSKRNTSTKTTNRTRKNGT